MKVKRYVVDSMPDALTRIRSDLGKDAVILNTKEIRQGGLWGWFGSKKIEVIAATDGGASSQAEAPIPVPPLSFGAEAAVALQQPASPLRPAAAPGKAAETQQGQAGAGDQAERPPQMTVTKPAQAAAPASVKSSEAVNGKSKPNASETVIYEEIKQMKRMVQQLADAANPIPEPPAEWRAVKTRLLEQEVAPDLVEQIMEPVRQEILEQPEGWDTKRIQQVVRKRLEVTLAGGGSKTVEPDTRVVHIVGPTGVGKTTTIAKLAAEQVIKHKRKVGFITADTYRISAVEQLKTYATILNVPLEVVFSPGDMERAYAQLADKDIIFMDTAGRNYRNELYVSELNALLQSQGKSETFLVLSMTTKYKDMKVIAENFMQFKLDKVLFTKMDETDSYGPILNLMEELPLKLSYVTNGQNVPEDIAEADESAIIDKLLGDAGHE